MISPLRSMRSKLARLVSLRDIKDRVTTPVLSASSLALALAPIFLLFWLMQPKVLANPGISALRVAGAASYEPFLHDAEPQQSAEPRLRESAARLTQHDPQYRDAAASAQRESKRGPSRSIQAHKNIKGAQGFAKNLGGHRRWNAQGQARSYSSPASRLATHEITR